MRECASGSEEWEEGVVGLPPTERETELYEIHARLMRTDDHDGSRHCQCAIARELTLLQEARWQIRLARLEAQRANRKTKKTDIHGVGC